MPPRFPPPPPPPLPRLCQKPGYGPFQVFTDWRLERPNSMGTFFISKKIPLFVQGCTIT